MCALKLAALVLVTGLGICGGEEMSGPCRTQQVGPQASCVKRESLEKVKERVRERARVSERVSERVVMMRVEGEEGERVSRVRVGKELTTTCQCSSLDVAKSHFVRRIQACRCFHRIFIVVHSLIEDHLAAFHKLSPAMLDTVHTDTVV